MRSFILYLVVFMLGVVCANAQHTTRPNLQVRPDALPAQSVLAKADTVYLESNELQISGYEKTLRSRKESLLATNNCTSRVYGARLTIDYIDMEGNQLHQRTVDVTWPEGIPVGETRMAEFKSWDSQQVWFYHLSMPTRTRLQATPYDVKIRIDYILTSRD